MVSSEEAKRYFNERNASLTQLEEFTYNYLFPITTVYLIWLQKAALSFTTGDPRRDLLISRQINTQAFIGKKLSQMCLYELDMIDQTKRVSEKDVEVPKDLGCWETKRLEQCLEGWQELLAWHNWYPKQSPFFAILSKGYPDLPRFINLGVKPYQFLQRRFDKTYIPSKDTITPKMMEAVFNELADFMDSEAFVDGDLKDKVMKRIVNNAGIETLPVGSQILDVACGTGWSANFIGRDKQIFGVDVSFRSLEIAEGKGILTLQTDAAFLPFLDNVFPVVICSYGAHWFKDFRPFQEMKRVLAKGGILSFNYHRSDNDWYTMRNDLLQITSSEDLMIDEVKIETERGMYTEHFLTYKKR